MYDEEEYLQLAGIQHYVFCQRQWALIHIEQQWTENVHTVEGHLFHQNAHNKHFKETRGDKRIIRGLRIHSPTLGISGECDVVEFHKDMQGITFPGMEGHWKPYPIEYKKGSLKDSDADFLQLCAQAMCLEEMCGCHITEGALFYGENKRRISVIFDDEIRQRVTMIVTEMHSLYKKGYTPKVKTKKACAACSLKSICLADVMKVDSVSNYIRRAIEE